MGQQETMDTHEQVVEQADHVDSDEKIKAVDQQQQADEQQPDNDASKDSIDKFFSWPAGQRCDATTNVDIQNQGTTNVRPSELM